MSHCPVGSNYGHKIRLVVLETRLNSYSYRTGPGIYGSKPTESEGVARGQGQFTLP